MLDAEVLREKQWGGKFALGGNVWSRQANSYPHFVVCLMIASGTVIGIGTFVQQNRTKKKKAGGPIEVLRYFRELANSAIDMALGWVALHPIKYTNMLGRVNRR